MTTVEDGVSPEALMGDFQGKKIIMVIILAIVFHAILILGTSYGYLRDEVFGKDTSEMPKEEKVQVAIGEATAQLSKIAERHGLELEDITSRFSATGSRSDKVADAPVKKATADNGKTSDTSNGGGNTEPDTRSKMEKEMLKPAEGPKGPDTKIDDDFGIE